MAEPKRNPGGWAACKRALADWPTLASRNG